MMKLSEAIRKGASHHPQGFGKYFAYNEQGELCSCALGAAYDDVLVELGRGAMHGALVPGNISNTILSHVEGIYFYTAIPLPQPYPDQMWSDSRVYNPSSVRILSAVTILNDDYRWTREQIADYLEQQGY